MAATTTDRQTPALFIERQIRLPLKAATAIPAGAMVATDATGAAVNASDTVGLTVQGRCEGPVDYANGDRWVIVSRGVFVFANNGNVVQASIGGLVTVVDNQTVGLAADTTNDIPAGYVEEIRAGEGVVVAMLGGKIGAA